MQADVPAQGWYRAGQGNATFFLAHRTGITVNIADKMQPEMTSGTLQEHCTILILLRMMD